MGGIGSGPNNMLYTRTTVEGSDCLDLNWFAILEDAREVIEGWRVHYNQVRPHRSLGKKPPAVFAKEAAMK